MSEQEGSLFIAGERNTVSALHRRAAKFDIAALTSFAMSFDALMHVLRNDYAECIGAAILPEEMQGVPLDAALFSDIRLRVTTASGRTPLLCVNIQPTYDFASRQLEWLQSGADHVIAYSELQHDSFKFVDLLMQRTKRRLMRTHFYPCAGGLHG